MEIFDHSIKKLFDQLGLNSTDQEISEFVRSHQLEHNTPLENASFWKPHQADFIATSKADDADWSEAVDDLDSLLHKDSMR